MLGTAFAEKLPSHKITVLTNADFKYGTYIIDKPGTYRLGEDISFNPNSPATLDEAIESGLIPPDVAEQIGLSVPVSAYRSGFPLYPQYLHTEPQGNNNIKKFTPGGPLDARYDPAGFGLGFFAAIVISADDVILDLAGYTIEQSAEHALLQRFFAVIELADQPFIPYEGPADFGKRIDSANNVMIKNGVIGRSAHHGIHGNNNERVKIYDVDFIGYEVGAVSLNGVTSLFITNSTAENRKDVPVLGIFSSAQFIKTYIEELYRNRSDTQLRVNGQLLSIQDIKESLESAINNVHHDIVIDQVQYNGRFAIDKNQHPDEFALFHNKYGVIDGNSYSYMLNHLGMGVNGFPETPNYDLASKNIWFTNVHVTSQRAFVNEIVALNQDGEVLDPVGAVFQTQNAHPETDEPITVSSFDKTQARYLGNPVANAQAFVAKAFINGEFDGSKLDLSRLSINQTVLKWIEADNGFEYLSSIVPTENDFLCNGDSMFHVNKGVIAFKMDAAMNIVMRNTSASEIVNVGQEGSPVCGDYSEAKSHPKATLEGYGGAKTRAFTFSGSKNVLLSESFAVELKSFAGSAVGVDTLTDSNNVRLNNVMVLGAEAGVDSSSVLGGPNEIPKAIGFHISKYASKISAKGFCAELLSGFGGELMIDNKSDYVWLREICNSMQLTL